MEAETPQPHSPSGDVEVLSDFPDFHIVGVLITSLLMSGGVFGKNEVREMIKCLDATEEKITPLMLEGGKLNVAHAAAHAQCLPIIKWFLAKETRLPMLKVRDGAGKDVYQWALESKDMEIINALKTALSKP